MARDDFTQATKDVLARRVNYLCSNPECSLATTGPHTNEAKAVNKGVAAHISAASAGGKRFEESLSAEERSSVTNGIWLCQNCAKLIDSDDERYTKDLLREWKSKAEAATQQSIESNSALLPLKPDTDLRIRASYAGGIMGTHIHLRIFNAGESPVFLASWYASWDGEQRGLQSSINCVRGTLPFRLQNQDYHDVVIDVGDHPISNLSKVGVMDGKNQWINAPDVDVSTIVQTSKRYAHLRPKADKSELEERLKTARVDAKAVITQSLSGQKQLEFVFTNNSDFPIKLQGAELKWEYDPPRAQPSAPNSKATVAEAGGSVGLACSSNDSLIQPGGSATFFVRWEMAGVLIETIVGDVKDDGIKVLFYSDTKMGWTAMEDEIPGTVREFAKYVVESRSPR